MSCLHEEANLYYKIYRLHDDIYRLERLIARSEMKDIREDLQERLRDKKLELMKLEKENALIEEMIRKEFDSKEQIPKDARTYTERRKEKARKKRVARRYKQGRFGV